MKVKTKTRHINKEKESIESCEKIKNNLKVCITILVYIYLFLIIAVMPFYAPQGYVDIGMNKYYFFRMTGLVCFGLIAVAAILLLSINIFMYMKYKKSMDLKLSVTDIAMLLYGGAVILSFLCTEWKEEAFWGTDGWYMGAVSQLMFIIIYFAVSRFAENEKMWYVLFMAVSFFVFLLGFLNRFSVYPFQMDGANPVFISTLGNINWFCSYWMVIFPVGMVFYWNGVADTILKKSVLILYLIVGFMTGIVQGSSSAFLALGTMIFVLFCLSFRDGRKLLRWLELMFIFAVSTLLIGILKNCFPESLNYDNTIAGKLTDFTVSIAILAVVAICYAVMHYWIVQKELEVKKLKVLRNVVVGIFTFIVIMAAALIIYYSVKPETAANSQMAQAFVIDDDWGNGRGATWEAGVNAVITMPIWEKLVGVGPDCFSNYVYSEPGISNMLYNVFGDARLTNSHNEWLTIFVNLGLFGALTYAAAFISAIIRQVKGYKTSEIVLVSALCIISYTMHNMVSFQQVICTPIVFIMLGMGEKSLRRQKIKNL